MSRGLIAVVPTFRPEASVLDLVRVINAHHAVLVSDDASPCTFDYVFWELEHLPNVSSVRHHQNAGIARGLNDGLRRAQVLGASWLLTVDQDTAIDRTYVPRILAFGEQLIEQGYRIGVVAAERVNDRSGVLTYPLRTLDHISVTEEVIQTGSMWSVEALTAIGGFDETLGIDAVDASACLRLREQGFVVAVVPDLEVHHAIGQAKTVAIFGRSIMLTQHDPERRATMVRNRLTLFRREFRQSPRHAIRTLRRVAVNQSLGLITEADRLAKIRGSIRGMGPDRNPKQ